MTDLQQANLITTAGTHFVGTNMLTKNSPWTPIVTMGFRRMEAQGIIQKVMKIHKDEFAFTEDQDGIPFSKISLLFFFLLVFFTVSIVLLAFEWFWFVVRKM